MEHEFEWFRPLALAGGFAAACVLLIQLLLAMRGTFHSDAESEDEGDERPNGPSEDEPENPFVRPPLKVNF